MSMPPPNQPPPPPGGPAAPPPPPSGVPWQPAGTPAANQPWQPVGTPAANQPWQPAGTPPGGGAGGPVWQPAGGPGKPGMSGCGKAAIVGVVVLAILGIGITVAAVAGVHFIGKQVKEATGPCPFVSNSAVREVLGPNAKAQKLGGIFKNLTSVINDNRVLAEAPSCWVIDGGAGAARIAKLTGGAKERFAKERALADPQTTDKGGGLSVTREGYFGSEVKGLGDEAFCTASDFTGDVGVLVRKGDTLVYASIRPSDFDPADLQADATTGALLNDKACTLAQKLARSVIG